MKKLFGWVGFPLTFAIIMTSCTYSVSNIMSHSEGQVTDMVDTEQDAQAEVNPNISVPIP